MADRTFDFMNSERIASLIENAKEKVVYVAPGVSKLVADALLKFAGNFSKDKITLILDPSPWVYRMGYGEPEGLQMLDTGKLNIRKCSGVRVGLICVDELMYVYTPTPMQLEREAHHKQTPNAIVISSYGSAEIMKAVELNEKPGDPPPEIGVGAMNQEEIEHARKELQERPPVSPNLSQQMHVISSEFQFVDLKFKGGKIERRTLSLTAKDLGIRKKKLSTRISGTFKVIDDENVPGLDKLNEKLVKIRERFLKNVEHYGPIIDYRDKEDFKNALETLKKEIAEFKTKTKDQLTKRLDKSRGDLHPLIASNLKKLTKTELAELVFPDKYGPDSLTAFITKYLEKRFPTADELLSGMECTFEFRMIAPEHLSDERFRKCIEKALDRSFDELAGAETVVGVKEKS